MESSFHDESLTLIEYKLLGNFQEMDDIDLNLKKEREYIST